MSDRMQYRFDTTRAMRDRLRMGGVGYEWEILVSDLLIAFGLPVNPNTLETYASKGRDTKLISK